MSSELKHKIMHMIKDGQVQAKSRKYFIISNALLFGLVFLLTFLIVVFVSYILFLIINAKLHLVPLFGFVGIKVLLFDLPWIMILLATLSLIILQLLIKHFEFAYKKPLIYSTLSTIIVVSVAGIMIQRSGIHHTLSKDGGPNKFPVIDKAYRNLDISKGDIIKCRILVKKLNTYKCQTEQEIIYIEYNEKTLFPKGHNINEGDFITTIGEKSTDTFTSQGIIKIRKPFFWKPNLEVR